MISFFVGPFAILPGSAFLRKNASGNTAGGVTGQKAPADGDKKDLTGAPSI